MWGLIDHCKDSGLYTEYGGESLEGVELGTGMI